VNSLSLAEGHPSPLPLEQVLQALPHAPVIVVICDNDSIHHARAVTAYLKEHPRLELLWNAA
jgi:hypothetical protein